MCAGKLACAKSSSAEYGAYSWAICGWTWNSGLSLTVASWAIAAEAKMNIEPAARANCKDFRICFSPSIFVHIPSDRATARAHNLILVGQWRRGRLLRVPAADGRTMQEFSGGYLI